jgi:hypothetical protein
MVEDAMLKRDYLSERCCVWSIVDCDGTCSNFRCFLERGAERAALASESPGPVPCQRHGAAYDSQCGNAVMRSFAAA